MQTEEQTIKQTGSKAGLVRQSRLAGRKENIKQTENSQSVIQTEGLKGRVGTDRVATPEGRNKPER